MNIGSLKINVNQFLVVLAVLAAVAAWAGVSAFGIPMVPLAVVLLGAAALYPAKS
jgi:hypothetical protein